MATGVSNFLFRVFAGPIILAIFQFFLLEIPLNLFYFFAGLDASLIGICGTSMFMIAIFLRINDYVHQQSESRRRKFCLGIFLGFPWFFGTLAVWRLIFIGFEGILQELNVNNQALVDIAEFLLGGFCSWYQYWEERERLSNASSTSNWLLERSGTDESVWRFQEIVCKLMPGVIVVVLINSIWFSGMLPGQPPMQRTILHLLKDIILTVSCYLCYNQIYEGDELKDMVEFSVMFAIMQCVLEYKPIVITELTKTLILFCRSFITLFSNIFTMQRMNRTA